jgi:hypothetical protein
MVDVGHPGHPSRCRTRQRLDCLRRCSLREYLESSSVSYSRTGFHLSVERAVARHDSRGAEVPFAETCRRRRELLCFEKPRFERRLGEFRT